MRKDQEDLRNAINLIPPPPLVLDSHMHTMTAYCTPLPCLWGRAMRGLSRSQMNWGALIAANYPALLEVRVPLTNTHLGLPREWYPGTGLGNMGLVGMKSTVQISDLAAASNPNDFEANEPKNPLQAAYEPWGVFPMMVTLPMDMEFAHYAGYHGLKLYYQVAQRQYIDTTVVSAVGTAGVGPSSARHRAYLPPEPDEVISGSPLPQWLRDEFAATRTRELNALRDQTGLVSVYHQRGVEPGKRYFTFWVTPDDEGNNRREVVWLKPEENNMFVEWWKQLEQIKIAALKHPLHILPLFHFEPRRWTGLKSYQSMVVSKSNAAMFLGMKMYPPLGYRPSDWGRIKGLGEFYEFCQSNEIPIMTHCSPEGFYTHERVQYFANELRAGHAGDHKTLHAAYCAEQDPDDHKSTGCTGQVSKKESNRYKQTWEEFYFTHNYVSPAAWEKVLAKFPKLKICLAHFGADDNGFSGWGKNTDKREDYGRGAGVEPWEETILRLVREYDNCYVDISFFFVKDNEKRLREIFANDRDDAIKNKILYGTDWYMIELENYPYRKFGLETKQVLDSIHPALWPRISVLNPIKFYNLVDVADGYAEGLRTQLSIMQKQKKLEKYGLKPEDIQQLISKRLAQFKKIQMHGIEPYAKSIGYKL